MAQSRSKGMKTQENFLVEFISEQVDMLAKMARIDGLEALAFILQMAKAEADLTQKKMHAVEVDGRPCPH
jgi:hypothetical protein